jgi:hypothetical protein
MNLLKLTALGALACAVGWAITRSRPAGLASARVTAITPGNPSIAHLALTYRAGGRPISQILTLTSGPATGSTTVNGLTLYADVPLHGQPRGPWAISCTGVYRDFGFNQVVRQEFVES